MPTISLLPATPSSGADPGTLQARAIGQNTVSEFCRTIELIGGSLHTIPLVLLKELSMSQSTPCYSAL